MLLGSEIEWSIGLRLLYEFHCKHSFSPDFCQPSPGYQIKRKDPFGTLSCSGQEVLKLFKSMIISIGQVFRQSRGNRSRTGAQGWNHERSKITSAADTWQDKTYWSMRISRNNYFALTKNRLLEVPWSMAPTRGPKSLKSPPDAILQIFLCWQKPLSGVPFKSLQLRTSEKQYLSFICHWLLPVNKVWYYVWGHYSILTCARKRT